MERPGRDCDCRFATSRVCAKTIGPRIHIFRFADASERCNGSNRPDQRNGSCLFTPPSRTPSTSNAILFPAIRSAPSEAKPSGIGGQRPRLEFKPSPFRLFLRPKPSSRDNPSRSPLDRKDSIRERFADAPRLAAQWDRNFSLVPASSVRQFTDPDEYSSSFRDFQYELNVTVGGSFSAEHVRVDLHELRLQHYSSNLPWVAHTAIPDGRAVFALRAVPGPSLLRAGKEIVTTSIERLARGQTIYTRSLGAVSWGTISLSLDALAAIGVAMSGREFAPPVDVTTETPEPGTMERLTRLYAAAGCLSRTVPEVLAHPEATRSLEHDLVRALAACLGPATNEEDAVAKRRHGAIMRRFRAIVATSGDRPVYTTELCAEIGVSDRTLGDLLPGAPRDEPAKISPSAANAARASRARTRRSHELNSDRNRHRHGFWELGRFAGVYRSFYGESPSQTSGGRRGEIFGKCIVGALPFRYRSMIVR